MGIWEPRQHRALYLMACVVAGGLAGGLFARLPGVAVLGYFAVALCVRLVLARERAVLVAGATMALVAAGLVLGPLQHPVPQMGLLAAFIAVSPYGALLALAVSAIVGARSVEAGHATWLAYTLGGLAALLGAAVVANLLTSDPGEFVFPWGAIAIALYAFPGAVFGGLLGWAIRYAADHVFTKGR